MRNERPNTFTWIYAAVAIVLVPVTIFAVTFAIQEHNDRVLNDEITGRGIGAGHWCPAV